MKGDNAAGEEASSGFPLVAEPSDCPPLPSTTDQDDADDDDMEWLSPLVVQFPAKADYELDLQRPPSPTWAPVQETLVEAAHMDSATVEVLHGEPELLAQSSARLRQDDMAMELGSSITCQNEPSVQVFAHPSFVPLTTQEFESGQTPTGEGQLVNFESPKRQQHQPRKVKSPPSKQWQQQQPNNLNSPVGHQIVTFTVNLHFPDSQYKNHLLLPDQPSLSSTSPSVSDPSVVPGHNQRALIVDQNSNHNSHQQVQIGSSCKIPASPQPQLATQGQSKHQLQPEADSHAGGPRGLLQPQNNMEISKPDNNVHGMQQDSAHKSPTEDESNHGMLQRHVTLTPNPL